MASAEGHAAWLWANGISSLTRDEADERFDAYLAHVAGPASAPSLVRLERLADELEQQDGVRTMAGRAQLLMGRLRDECAQGYPRAAIFEEAASHVFDVAAAEEYARVPNDRHRQTGRGVSRACARYHVS